MAYIVQLNTALHHTDSMDTEWRRGCAPYKPKLTRTRAGKVTNITSIDAVRISNDTKMVVCSLLMLASQNRTASARQTDCSITSISA
eukprot:580164-Lingulodinium_polyedra.AAC.1